MELNIAIIVILSIITITLVAVGVYVILILKELRETIQKANTIIDDFESVTSAISHPMSIITGVIEGYKAVKSLREKD